MSNHQLICLETHFKQRLNNVKTIIKEKLGVGVSTTNAYDIMAASQGFGNYQTAKGRSAMPYYEWRTNIGTKEHPYFAKIPIGHHRNSDEAQKAGASLLSTAPEYVTWILFEDGKMTSISFNNIDDSFQFDLTNIHSFIRDAINLNVTEILLHQDDSNSKTTVDCKTRTGWMKNVRTIVPKGFYSLGITPQLKAMSGYKGNEEQPSQLSFTLQSDCVNVDIRVRRILTNTGNNFVFRLHDPRIYNDNESFLDECDAFMRLKRHAQASKNGLYLITGEAGSGKTTASTYLSSLVQESKQAPDGTDVVLFGEIRDPESLDSATEAAQSKVVIAEMHSTDSNVLQRLKMLCNDTRTIDSVLKGVYSQVLIRSGFRGKHQPIGSFLHIENGRLVGKDLFEETLLFYNEGDVTYDGMHKLFGRRFDNYFHPQM